MPQGAIPVRIVNSSATGNSWFVDETTGDDDNNGSAASPFATLAAAQAAAVADNNDVVYLIGTVHVTATVAWAKNGVSLVGLTAPSANCRARISSSGSTVFTPMVLVSASNCSFVNIATFYGYADASAQVCWQDSGGRNFYSNCIFQGGGNATAAAQAGMRSLLISGSTGEHQFVGCTIGLDTIARATNANASLELTGGSPRNIMRNCIFRMLSSLATNLHIKIGASGIDRYLLLDNCAFINAIDSTATAITNDITADAAAGGSVLCQNPISLGATNLSASGPVYLVGPVPNGNTSAIAVAAS